MKFKTTVQEVKKAISVLEPIINHAHSSIIYRYIAIRPHEEGKIEFKVFDDYAIGSSFINCYDYEGEDKTILVLAKHFIGLINSFGKDELTITLEDNKCGIKCGKSRYKLQILDEKIVSENFPSLDVNYYVPEELIETEGAESSVIETNEFGIAYNSVSHCLSKDNSQMTLQNICCTKGEMIALDGSLGAMVEYEIPGIDLLVLHKKACNCLLGIPNQKLQLVKIDERIYGIADNFVFLTTCDDDYPYEGVKARIDGYSNKHEIQIKINPDEIVDKLGRVLMFADPETHSIAVSCDEGNFILTVENNASAKEVINLFENVNKNNFNIYVDGRSLKEALGKTLSDARWVTSSEEEVQYLYDGSLLQFFFGLES